MPKLWRAEARRTFTVEKGDKGVCVYVFSICPMPFKCFYHTFHNFLLILHGCIAWSKGEGKACPPPFFSVCSALRRNEVHMGNMRKLRQNFEGNWLL